MANITGTSGNDSLDGTESDDTINGLGGDDTLNGLAGSDTLNGGDGNDSLLGGDDNDILRQSAGADTLDGGAGSDRIEFTASGIVYGGATGVSVNLATHVSDLNNAAAGADSTLVSIETVFGTAGNDVFIGGDLAHAPDVLGNRTTETFRPLGGDDTVTGGDGYFSARVDYSNATLPVTVNLGAGSAKDDQGGTDTIIRVEQVFGGPYSDMLLGGSLERSASGGFFELFRGNAGNDTIDGAGTDAVLGAAGGDRANYGNSPAAVIVNLGVTPYVVGKDTVLGGTARDGFGTIDTLRNINQVSGSPFADTLIGEADNHRLIGLGGNDTLVGAAYGVEADYSDATSAVIANLATGKASDGDGGTDTLINITDLRGSDFDDDLRGSDADNRLSGGPGADTIDGGAGIDFASYSDVTLANGGITAFIENGFGRVNDGMGSTDTLTNIEGLAGSHANDTLSGGAGDQWFQGRGGSDTIDGGAGNDWVSYRSSEAGVVVDLQTGTASNDGWGGVWNLGGSDTLISIENAAGSPFADHLIGSAHANELRGDDGDDTLDGGDGTDTAVYENARVDYTITPIASGFTVSGPDGTDTLISIERFEFSDQRLALDLGTDQSAGNTVRVIGAAFDAPAIQAHPDWVGIGLEFFDSGMSMQAVCELVVQILGLSNTDFVTSVYTNVVGIAPSVQDRDHFVGLLQGNGGTMTQAELLVLAANAGVNEQNINLVGLQASGVEFA